MAVGIIIWTQLVSSGNLHWTHSDLDMCPPSNVSSGNFHRTQATPLLFFSFHCFRFLTSNPIHAYKSLYWEVLVIGFEGITRFMFFFFF